MPRARRRGIEVPPEEVLPGLWANVLGVGEDLGFHRRPRGPDEDHSKGFPEVLVRFESCGEKLGQVVLE